MLVVHTGTGMSPKLGAKQVLLSFYITLPGWARALLKRAECHREEVNDNEALGCSALCRRE